MVNPGSESRAVLERRADAAIIAAVGYFVLAMIAIQLTSTGYDIATIWPADAIILTLLLREPRSNWGWVLAAGWAANLAANTVARGWSPVLVTYGVINMGQTLLAAWLVLRRTPQADVFATNRAIWRFVFYAGGVAVLIAALIGATVTALTFGEPFLISVGNWYFSNALALLVLTPFLCALFDGGYARWLQFANRREAWSAAGGYGLLLFTTGAVFIQSFVPLLFLPMCLVTYLSFRLGRLGTKLGVMLVAFVGLGATLAGKGPVAGMPVSPQIQTLFLQLYLGALLLTCLPIASLVTSRRRLTIRLAEHEEALRQVLESTANACLGFDSSGQCKWATGPVQALLGISAEEMIGRSCEVVSLQVHELMQDLGQAFRSGDFGGQGATRLLEFFPMRRPGLVLEGTVGLLRQGREFTGWVVTLRDVTERRALDIALIGRSETDRLTGVCARESFLVHLDQAMEEVGRPISLALVDLDRFHMINEEHGLVVGDAALVEVARRIKRNARDTDVVARLGADQFALLLRCDILTARSICERIAEAVRQSPICRAGDVAVLSSVSCGVVQLRSGMTPEDAQGIADTALRDMKQSGRNGVRVVA